MFSLTTMISNKMLLVLAILMTATSFLLVDAVTINIPNSGHYIADGTDFCDTSGCFNYPRYSWSVDAETGEVAVDNRNFVSTCPRFIDCISKCARGTKYDFITVKALEVTCKTEVPTEKCPSLDYLRTKNVVTSSCVKYHLDEDSAPGEQGDDEDDESMFQIEV